MKKFFTFIFKFLENVDCGGESIKNSHWWCKMHTKLFSPTFIGMHVWHVLLLSYFWLERLPSCVTLFPEQTDTSGQVKLSILHLSSALVFLTIWPDQLCQFVPLCLPPQKDCYKVSPSYFATIQTFLRFFLRHFNEMQSFTFISYYKSELFKIFP